MYIDRTGSHFGGAGAAGLELAAGTFVDEPVRAGVAHVAVPEDEGGVGLDDPERVGALGRLGHGC